MPAPTACRARSWSSAGTAGPGSARCYSYPGPPGRGRRAASRPGGGKRRAQRTRHRQQAGSPARPAGLARPTPGRNPDSQWGTQPRALRPQRPGVQCRHRRAQPGTWTHRPVRPGEQNTSQALLCLSRWSGFIISDKVDFRRKNITQDKKKGVLHNDKRSVHQANTAK